MGNIKINCGYHEENGSYKRKDYTFESKCPWCKEDIKFQGSTFGDNAGIVGTTFKNVHYLIHRKCFTPLALSQAWENIKNGIPSWSK